MHEIGLLYQTARTVSRFAEENGISDVRVIDLEIGELTGVLPDVFEEYFEYVTSQFDCLKNASLKLTMVKARGLCLECGSLYDIMKYQGVCPKCHSPAKKVLSGGQLFIRQIEY